MQFTFSIIFTNLQTNLCTSMIDRNVLIDILLIQCLANVMDCDLRKTDFKIKILLCFLQIILQFTEMTLRLLRPKFEIFFNVI